MKLATQIANQVREVLLNGTWVASNFKTELKDLTWQQATTKIRSLNTIAALTFHIHYYINGLIKVLKGGSLDIKDKYSFDAPPIISQKDWEHLLNNLWIDAETFATFVEQMPDKQLMSPFVDEQYGNYYRNIQGIIGHSYYHLGQIVLIKKLLQNDKN
jgi:hypothetical protein